MHNFFDHDAVVWNNDRAVDDGQAPEVLEQVEQSAGQDQAQEAMSMEKFLAISADYQQKLEQAQKENLLLRADMENMKRRQAETLQRYHEFEGIADFAQEVLKILDNVERALESLKAASPDDPFLTGLQMIHQSFLTVLSKFHIQELPAVGAQLNPAYHQVVDALSEEEAQAQGIASHEICGVYQKGFSLNKRVLRPAMVKVAP